MTAEIAIANKHAVALAADSKVTLTSTGMSKGYDTANKVFTLSKVHPVGIMIFGNAEFMGYPWETIIKIYRNKIGSVCKPTIAEWAQDFADFVRNFGSIDRTHKEANLVALISSVLRELEDAADAEYNQLSSDSETVMYGDVLEAVLQRRLTSLNSRPTWLPKAKLTQLGKNYSSVIADSVMMAMSHVDNDAAKKLAIQVALSSLVHDVDTPNMSGYVIAGFGEAEMFPTICEYHTNGYVGDTLHLAEKAQTDIRRSESASIRAFAQGDMVQSFMDGYDRKLMMMAEAMFGEALRDSCVSVLNTYGLKKFQTAGVEQEIREAAESRTETLLEDFRKISAETFSSPVMTMVNLLPKDELAHLAESLVALTSLKRRVSREVETVGGAIDVALISKGDGFVWIKRKHYFKPELNPQFFRNYFRDTV
jgi:hypothetical protein